MNKKSPIFISFYVANTPSEKEAQGLKACCKNFELECDIQAIADLGSTAKNDAYKPLFILQMLEKHKRPVVWVEADSHIQQKPIFFEECYADVALRIDDTLSFQDKDKIQTKTLFVNNTASAKKLLQLWVKECERLLASDKGLSEQVCLRKVILHYPTIVEIKRLPASYHAPASSAQAESAVIVHKAHEEALVASR